MGWVWMNCRGTATSAIWKVTLRRNVAAMAQNPGANLDQLLSGARYCSKWYIDDSDGPLLFGLGIHGLYLFVDAEWQLVVAKVSSQELPLDAARITSTFRAVGGARPGGLGFAPNGREPRLPMARQSRRAVVMAQLDEAGRGDVIAPSVEIEEAGIAIVAQALLVIPSRI